MIDLKQELYACPCCGSFTLSELGGYEICTICFWEDDPIQVAEPNYSGGANKLSLSESREEWLKLNTKN
jgi:hypothetical protein